MKLVSVVFLCLAAAIVAADNCQGCHQADPWLHSPWIDQLRHPDDPSQPGIGVSVRGGLHVLASAGMAPAELETRVA